MISKGQYGGDMVMLWDRNTWAPVAVKTAATLDDGHLHLPLVGERIRGESLVVRREGYPGEQRENWLLRKTADAGHDLAARARTSVATGHSMAEIAAGVQRVVVPAPKAKGKQSKRMAAKPLAFRQPQLTTMVDAVPTGNGWLHEIKLDGYRVQVAAGCPASCGWRPPLTWGWRRWPPRLPTCRRSIRRWWWSWCWATEW